MTPNEAVTYLHTFDIPAIFRNVVPARIYADYEQHCYVEVLNCTEEKITSLHERGKLKAWFYRLCRYTANNRRSRFYQQDGELHMVVRKTIKFEPIVTPKIRDGTADD
jgi:hypothetical protein